MPPTTFDVVYGEELLGLLSTTLTHVSVGGVDLVFEFLSPTPLISVVLLFITARAVLSLLVQLFLPVFVVVPKSGTAIFFANSLISQELLHSENRIL